MLQLRCNGAESLFGLHKENYIKLLNEFNNNFNIIKVHSFEQMS